MLSISLSPRAAPHRKTRMSWVAAIVGTFVFLLALVPAARAAKCPDSVKARNFTSKTQLRKMTAKFNSFGPRVLGSTAHNKSIDWLEGQSRRIGLKTHSIRFKPYAWLPKTRFKHRPGLDISSAGGLTVRKSDGSTVKIADAGAVHWSKATNKRGRAGQLVYLPPEEEITPENSAGKIVVRDFQLGSIPFGLLSAILGIYVTPDLEGYADYVRPYLSPNVHEDSLAAGEAGASGVIYVFDVPQKQIHGYYDPHVGTIYRQPEIFVGRAQGEQLKALAAEGSTARVSVQARITRAKSRNLIARLPGRSSEKMVLAANTDGNSWVQENGVIGMLAFARYYAKLPLSCRPRTLELVFSTGHDAYRNDGLLPSHYPLSKKLAFAFTIEHLGTREIMPTGDGANKRLKFTGVADPALFGAGDSETLRKAAVRSTKRRSLPRTAVLKGLGLPNSNQAPPICSMGGLGTSFHTQLIPTLAMISGPWSLYDPVFGAKAIDFGQMRTQVLAAGDTVLALDGLPRAEIDGDYPALQAELTAGTKTPCPTESLPQFAPGPGA